MINLSNYQAIETALFVKMICNYYRATPTDTPTTKTFTFSQYSMPITFNGDTYAPLGQLLGVSNSSSQLRVSPGELTLTISGIPNSSIAEIVNSKIKGSSIKIYRMFFDPITKRPLTGFDNPVGRFQGIVNNYSLEETRDLSEATNTILLTCASSVEILNNKISGRRTNPVDQKIFYPSDLSMDRVPNLANSNFNFGVVVK